MCKGSCQWRRKGKRTGLDGVVVLEAAQGEDEQTVAEGVDAEANEGHNRAAVDRVAGLRRTHTSVNMLTCSLSRSC